MKKVRTKPGLAAAVLVVAVSVVTAVVASAVEAETASGISYLRLKPQKKLRLLQLDSVVLEKLCWHFHQSPLAEYGQP
jgi:hypothetical protein